MKKLNVEFCLLITNFMLYHWGEYIDKKQLKCELTHKHNIENVWHIGHFSLQEILGHDCKHFGYGLAVQSGSKEQNFTMRNRFSNSYKT